MRAISLLHTPDVIGWEKQIVGVLDTIFLINSVEKKNLELFFKFSQLLDFSVAKVLDFS